MHARTINLVAALCLTGCVADPADEPVATQQQELGAGCTLLRPYGWNEGNRTCFESQWITSSYAMSDGEIYYAADAWNRGAASVQCVNGWLFALPGDTCRPDGVQEN